MKLTEKQKEWKKNYRLKNLEKIRQQNRIASKKFRKNHPEYNEKEKTRKAKGVVHLMEKLINLKKLHGGKCIICGYKEEIRILQFHHLRDKKFNLSRYNTSKLLMEEEAKKCVLLCPNCHALEHLSRL